LGSFALRSFDPYNVTNRQSTRLPAMGFSNLTHLRICEPADVWCSPSAMVEAFGTLPLLSHLQVARRANANQANDEGFALSISDLLASRPTLKTLVRPRAVYLFKGQKYGIGCMSSAAQTRDWSWFPAAMKNGKTDGLTYVPYAVAGVP
ncbi:hypothetical protein C0992_009588, partial [Termitomyces sp. T32_za158]